MVLKKRKKKDSLPEEIVTASLAEPEKGLVFADEVPSLTVPPSEVLALMQADISSKTDEISRLNADNAALSAKITSLTLRISALLKEKEQLLIQLNNRMAKE